MSNDSTFQDRLPPHNLEAERSVLGACLIDDEVAPTIVSILKPEYFYKAAHKVIFNAVSDLAFKHDGIDILSISNYLETHGQTEDAGGVSYLAELQAHIMTAANAESHAGIIKEKFLLRKLISNSHETIKNIFDGNESTQDILDRAEQRIFEIADHEIKKEAVSLKDVLTKTIHELDSNNWKPQDGIKSGFRQLDRITLGFHPGELVIIAARPSMGKTSLALNIAKHMAMMEDMPVAFYSLEMSSDNLAKNLLCMHGQIDSQKFRSGTLTLDDRKQMALHLGELSEAPIYLDDTPGISPFELRLSARRLQDRYGIKAIFIDYLQLMRMGERTESRQVEISKISGSLKALAMELKVPVIALSQLSRKLEDRTDKRPMMSDLRESGSIEQDADTIIMLFRDWVYDKTKPEKGAELNIVKQRNGPTGGCPLVFLSSQLRFENAENPYG
jgi:replicative DNA helicase